MKKLILASMALLVITAFPVPSAQAAPICFKFVQFCDGIQFNFYGLGGASWYHYDCVNNAPMDTKARLYNGAKFQSNCPTNDPGAQVRTSGGPVGNAYFIVDSPLDGTMDAHTGIYPFGTCVGDNLAYVVQMGSCTGIAGGDQERSSIQ